MIQLVAVGRIRASHYRDAIDDYARRLQRFTTFRTLEVADSNPATEARQILQKVGRRKAGGGVMVACDLGGEAWDSHDLATFLGKHAQASFVIGGPEGLDDPVRSRADVRLELSRLTLPHELARLVLVEQLYRGFTIARGHPYHR